MDIYQTIVRPIITEKSTHQVRFHSDERGGAYHFEVHPDASKAQIRDAVEKIYGVKVTKVNTQNRPGRMKRFRMHMGTTRHWKKAVVILDSNSHIDLF